MAHVSSFKALRTRKGLTEIDSPNDFDLIASLLPKTSSSTGREGSDSNTTGGEDEDEADDEVAREISLVLLRLVWTQALSQLDSMNQELDLLRSAPPPPPPGPSVSETEGGDSTWRLDRMPLTGGPDGNGPLMDSQG